MPASHFVRPSLTINSIVIIVFPFFRRRNGHLLLRGYKLSFLVLIFPLFLVFLLKFPHVFLFGEPLRSANWAHRNRNWSLRNGSWPPWNGNEGLSLLLLHHLFNQIFHLLLNEMIVFYKFHKFQRVGLGQMFLPLWISIEDSLKSFHPFSQSSVLNFFSFGIFDVLLNHKIWMIQNVDFYESFRPFVESFFQILVSWFYLFAIPDFFVKNAFYISFDCRIERFRLVSRPSDDFFWKSCGIL